jgi:hypothetical protein
MSINAAIAAMNLKKWFGSPKQMKPKIALLARVNTQ